MIMRKHHYKIDECYDSRMGRRPGLLEKHHCQHMTFHFCLTNFWKENSGGNYIVL